jgi:1,4-alpha-glucan branching enzyme
MGILRKKTEIKLPELDGGYLSRVAHGAHHDPHSLLGIHPHEKGWIVRTVKPMAKSVAAVFGAGEMVALTHLADGVWQGYITAKNLPDYRIVAIYQGEQTDTEWRIDDPYRHAPTKNFGRHLVRTCTP